MTDAASRGRGYDHALRLADGTQLVGIHDEHRWGRGEHVSATLATAGCLLLGAEHSVPAEAGPSVSP